uniref:(northern house mosquito) hypothetical protein n=1 Tax=Culex pipiens TaxID=7175 RepID=A0A8D8B5Q3_CULPI
MCPTSHPLQLPRRPPTTPNQPHRAHHLPPTLFARQPAQTVLQISQKKVQKQARILRHIHPCQVIPNLTAIKPSRTESTKLLRLPLHQRTANKQPRNGPVPLQSKVRSIPTKRPQFEVIPADEVGFGQRPTGEGFLPALVLGRIGRRYGEHKGAKVTAGCVATGHGADLLAGRHCSLWDSRQIWFFVEKNAQTSENFQSAFFVDALQFLHCFCLCFVLS